MSRELQIEFENENCAYQPGDVVEGTVRWALAKKPDKLELLLFWHTSGKGTADVAVIDRCIYEQLLSSGSEYFSFTLPTGPYSFSGRLISLQWSLELTAIPNGITVRKDIIVSPDAAEVILTEADVPSRNKKAWFKRTR